MSRPLQEQIQRAQTLAEGIGLSAGELEAFKLALGCCLSWPIEEPAGWLARSFFELAQLSGALDGGPRERQALLYTARAWAWMALHKAPAPHFGQDPRKNIRHRRTGAPPQ